MGVGINFHNGEVAFEHKRGEHAGLLDIYIYISSPQQLYKFVYRFRIRMIPVNDRQLLISKVESIREEVKQQPSN